MLSAPGRICKDKSASASDLQPCKQQRKSKTQVKFLEQYFKDPSLKITDEIRRECCLKTGLKWAQIYKWLFDRKNAKKSSLWA